MSNSTNSSIPFDTSNCTVATCSVKEYGQIQYIPNLAANVAYTAIFAILLILQILQGVRYKTWGYLVGMFFGIILEIVGYVGRIMLHDNIFEKNYFIIYLIGLTIGPAFLTASIYLCLGRIITVYGVNLSLLKPRTVSIVFVFADFISLLLQAIGGAIASTADDDDGSDLGVNVMIAGLASQVISLAIFMVICAHFAWKVRKNPMQLNSNPEYVSLRNSRRWKLMLFGKHIYPVSTQDKCSY